MTSSKATRNALGTAGASGAKPFKAVDAAKSSEGAQPNVFPEHKGAQP